MKLIFEKSVPGRRCAILGKCDVDYELLPEGFAREEAPALPELSEVDLSRHELDRRCAHGYQCSNRQDDGGDEQAQCGHGGDEPRVFRHLARDYVAPLLRRAVFKVFAHCLHRFLFVGDRFLVRGRCAARRSRIIAESRVRPGDGRHGGPSTFLHAVDSNETT